MTQAGAFYSRPDALPQGNVVFILSRDASKLWVNLDAEKRALQRRVAILWSTAV